MPYLARARSSPGEGPCRHHRSRWPALLRRHSKPAGMPGCAVTPALSLSTPALRRHRNWARRATPGSTWARIKSPAATHVERIGPSSGASRKMTLSPRAAVSLRRGNGRGTASVDWVPVALAAWAELPPEHRRRTFPSRVIKCSHGSPPPTLPRTLSHHLSRHARSCLRRTHRLHSADPRRWRRRCGNGRW